jgi:hypothetical protein
MPAAAAPGEGPQGAWRLCRGVGRRPVAAPRQRCCGRERLHGFGAPPARHSRCQYRHPSAHIRCQQAQSICPQLANIGGRLAVLPISRPSLIMRTTFHLTLRSWHRCDGRIPCHTNGPCSRLCTNTSLCEKSVCEGMPPEAYAQTIAAVLWKMLAMQGFGSFSRQVSHTGCLRAVGTECEPASR